MFTLLVGSCFLRVHALDRRFHTFKKQVHILKKGVEKNHNIIFILLGGSHFRGGFQLNNYILYNYYTNLIWLKQNLIPTINMLPSNLKCGQSVTVREQ